jgi:general secretion pathway protein C
MDWKTTLQPVINSRLTERLPLYVNIALIIALTHGFAQFSWKMFPAPQLDEITFKPVVNTGTQPGRVEKKQTQSISQWHLFGEVKKDVAPKPVEQVKVPETRLNLKLLGVMSSKSDAVAMAIIADSSGNEEFYTIGAQIPGGAVLEEIHPDKVIIKRNNRLETLLLPKEVANSGPAGSSSRSPTSRSLFPRSNVTRSVNLNQGTGALLRQYRDALINDPQSVMNLVRAQPVREGGRLIGYRIRPGKDRRLLRKFGLRSGDVVTGVNGISLDNPIKGLEIMKNLTSATQVTVDIKRRGVTQSLSFQID